MASAVGSIMQRRSPGGATEQIAQITQLVLSPLRGYVVTSIFTPCSRTGLHSVAAPRLECGHRFAARYVGASCLQQDARVVPGPAFACCVVLNVNCSSSGLPGSTVTC